MDRSPDKRTRVLTALVAVIALIMVGAVLKFAQAVVIPLIFAWLLSHLLGPVVNFLARRHVPSGVSAGIIIGFLLILTWWAATRLTVNAQSLFDSLPDYIAGLGNLLKELVEKLKLRLGDNVPENIDAQVNEFLTYLRGLLLQFGATLLSVVPNFLSKAVLVLVFLLFLLLEKPYARKKILAAFPRATADKVCSVQEHISTRISQYLAVQTLISIVTGVLVWATCRVFGVSGAISWGILTFCLNYIPTLGSIVASVPPILIAFIQTSYWNAMGVGVTILIIQQIMGNVITPKMLGDRLDISPVVILMSLLFWGWLWGPVGALLSVVIISAIKIICENIEALKPLAILMRAGKHVNAPLSD